jgi:hypothetical protein
MTGSPAYRSRGKDMFSASPCAEKRGHIPLAGH